jgi:hypothetical protein
MIAFIIVIVSAYVLLKLSPYFMAYFEKEHVRNDFEPKEYDPTAWNSVYLIKQDADAKDAGLKYCGSYFTAKHASVVKGYMLLYVNPDNNAIVSLISARFGSSELKKVVISTRFTDGTAFVTSDGFQLPDYTNGILKQTLYRVSIVELLQAHAGRLGESEKKIERVTSDNAFRLYEDIEFNRGERLVAMGYGRWADPAQSRLRRTIRGVFACVNANRMEKNALIKKELAKRNEGPQPHVKTCGYRVRRISGPHVCSGRRSSTRRSQRQAGGRRVMHRNLNADSLARRSRNPRDLLNHETHENRIGRLPANRRE